VPFFSPFWYWLLDQIRDPDLWFFLVGPGFALVAGTIMGLLYLGSWATEARDQFKFDREVRANRDAGASALASESDP
jgi:hypothetical protein